MVILDGHWAACDMYHGERDCKSNRVAIQNNTKHRAGSRAAELFLILRMRTEMGPKMGPSPILMQTELHRSREFWPKVRYFLGPQTASRLRCTIAI